MKFGFQTVLHLSLLSMNSLNQTQAAIFTILLHFVLPGDHIPRMFSNDFDLNVNIKHNTTTDTTELK